MNSRGFKDEQQVGSGDTSSRCIVERFSYHYNTRIREVKEI